MLPHRHRPMLRSTAITAINNEPGAEAFDPMIDFSSLTDQSQSPLFNTLPSEVRTRIFQFACTDSDDLDKPYAEDRVYYRPGYKFRHKVHISLLQTCKRIYDEARLMPVSEAEHTFWMFGGPLRLIRTRKHALGNFPEWQESLNEEQKAAVNHVHLFVQQYYLEKMGTLQYLGTQRRIWELKFNTKVFTLTFRHSDWWSWESPSGSSDQLGICPWLPERVSQQAMISQPLKPTVEHMRATMIEGTWGWQIGQIKGLEVLRIEFETDAVKKNQLEIVLSRAKNWIFPLHDSNAFLESDGKIKESEWVGQAQLKQDSAAQLRHVASESEPEPEVAMRTYYVAEMAWKKRTLP